MKKIKAIVLSVIAVLTFSFATQAATPINTTKMENAVRKAAFIPTLVSIQAPYSSTLGIQFQAIYSSQFAPAGTNIALDVNFTVHESFGHIINVHWYVVFNDESPWVDGQEEYLGEYYPGWPNGSTISNIVVNSTIATNQSYPYQVTL